MAHPSATAAPHPGSMQTRPRTRQSVIEIEIEQFDDGFWRSTLADVSSGASDSGRFRFIARLPDDPGTRFVGSPFTMPRTSVAQLADDVQLDLDARVRLGEMDTALTTAGWQDAPERGERWWSLRYTRS